MSTGPCVRGAWPMSEISRDAQAMSQPLAVYIGWDERETLAYHVLCHSIIRRASGTVSITPLVQDALRTSGIYTRERGVQESTAFTYTRFLIPYLCGYRGHAIFLDCDMLCRVNLHTILDEIGGGPRDCPPWAVMVCKHDYVPRSATKFLGNQQTASPRKNWSSVIVWNN